MKSPFRPFLMVVLILALAQTACSLSAPALSPTLQAVVSTAAQAAQTLAAALPTDNPSASTLPASGTPAARGTPDEAQAMLKLAIAHYLKVGRTQALADFTNRVAPFFDRDLYVACIDSHLVQSANGGFSYLVGSSTQPLSRARWDAASTTKIDSITYSWLNPANNQNELKTFYYEKVGVDVCGVGAYHP